MLESLVKCYWADLEFPECTFFQKKLLFLEKELNKKKMSMSKLLEETGRDYVALWGKLSGDWIHTQGIVNKIVNEIAKKTALPAYALAIPMNYNDTDLDLINELQHRISEFRSLLKATIDEWNKKFGDLTKDM